MLDPMQSGVALFPMFLRLEGRHCLVVGAGVIAEGKITALLSAGARVTVVAPHARRRIACMARRGRIEWHAREFQLRDLAGVFLVIAATSSPKLHQRIWRAARRRGVLCNVVDDPPLCDFYYPAIVRRGPLQIAISTSGQSLALAQQLRHQLEAQFGPAYATWVAQLGRARRRAMRVEPSIARRKKLAHDMVRRDILRMRQSGLRSGLDRP
jgi:precorrin-2 dehydrogenase / sirohydrochlorin ferrochelatase